MIELEKGTGNLFFVASTMSKSEDHKTLLRSLYSKFYRDCEVLDLMELINFYRGAFEVGFNDDEFNKMVD